MERSNSGSDQTNSNSGSHGEERGFHPDIEDDDIENMFSGGIGGGVDGGDNGGSGDISSGFKRRPDGVQERSLQGDRVCSVNGFVRIFPARYWWMLLRCH